MDGITNEYKTCVRKPEGTTTWETWKLLVKLIARHRVMWTGIILVWISYGPGIYTIYRQFLVKGSNHNVVVHLCVKPFIYSIGIYAGQKDNFEIYGRSHVNLSNERTLLKMKHTMQHTRWFKYDRDWFVCKQAALRSSCATLREWSHNLHPPFCSV